MYGSIDPGFGNFKGVVLGNGHPPAVTVVPSVIGAGEMVDLGALSLGSLGRRQKQDVPVRVTFDGMTYLVGKGVEQHTDPIQRLDFNRLFDGPEARALFYTTLGQALGGSWTGSVRLMLGLPVEVMADKALSQVTMKGLRSWMVGDHQFTLDDEAVFFRVTKIQAMAQPAGAFFAWGMDDHGKWVRDTDDLRAPVAVGDIGFNTLDMFSVKGGAVQARFTDGDTVGMRRAAEHLIDVVGRKGIKLSLYEADMMLRQRRPELWTVDGKIDLGPQVRQALDKAAAGIIALMERCWGNGRQFAHLLFTGGGSEALEEMLLQQYPHGVVLPDAVGANAVGLARYAARVFA